jgi:hypothetical protein
MMSLFTVIVAAIPIQNKTLKFVAQNGAVNLYMFLVAYFFEPFSADDFSYEKEGVDEFFTTGSSGSNIDKSRDSSEGNDKSRHSSDGGISPENTELNTLPFSETSRALNFND